MKTPEYQHLINTFAKWLTTLDYAQSTIYASVNYVRDFFFYLEANQINAIEQIQPETPGNYYNHLQTRKNKTKSGSLSDNYIISNINALRRFSRYLSETGKPSFEIGLNIDRPANTGKTILTTAEINKLYKNCDNSALGQRDRAMLSIFYGCGLRRTEGVNLDIKDILLKEKRVYVRRGKNYRERYVPMSAGVKTDLEKYIRSGRKKLLTINQVKQEALFVSQQASRLSGNAIIERIHHLCTKANIQKETGLHTLRHSIATHLLQSGMTLEDVSRFLGHASLESTQIYTHLAYE